MDEKEFKTCGGSGRATALCIFAVVPTDVFAKNIGPYAWKGAWSTNQSGEITRNVKDNTSSVRTVINEMSSSISSIRMSIYASKNYYNEKATYLKNTPSYEFVSGTEWYMTNYVRENNYRYAVLYATQVNGAGNATGIWNPDTTDN